MRASAPPLALALPALLAACGGSGAEPAPGPNVLVVVVDTLRADRLPFYGHGVDNAPFLSELAERGVVFERAWSTSSWTAPASASLFTSLYPDQFLGDVRGIQVPDVALAMDSPEFEIYRIPDALETMPEAMQRLGYRTFAVTDNPNLCAAEGFDSGFLFFENYDNHGAAEVNAKLAEWAERIREGGKWFVYLHYMDPHYPYQRQEPWFEPPPGPEPGPDAPRELVRPWIDATYDSEIRFTDEHIREAFELLGVDDDTVVVFTADHGESLLQRGPAMQHGFELFSELTHIPLVVHHPGAERVRTRVAHNVSLVDVLPTLRDIVGAPPSEQDVGESLVPYYTEPGERPDDRPVFAMRNRLDGLGGGKLTAVIRGDEKLITGTHPDLDEPVHFYYDIGADWWELDNRAAVDPDGVRTLSELWDAFWESAPQYEPQKTLIRLDAEEAARIDELGYGGDSEPNADGATTPPR